MEYTKEEMIAKNPNYQYTFIPQEKLRTDLKNLHN